MIDFIIDAINEPINIVFASIIGVLFLADLITYFRKEGKKHKSFGGVITGVGIFGTFVGISLALYEFNVDDIDGSVPELLKGMKTAFFTSVLGMFASLLISVIQTFISSKFAKTGSPLADKLTEQNQIFSDVFDSIQKSNDSIDEQVQGMREESQMIGEKSNEILNTKLTEMNEALSAALQKLSEGANKEIIEALNNVIKDFNTNLEESFGGNLARLSDGVDNMLEWQKTYLSSIQEFENGLSKAIESIDTTDEKMQKIQDYQAEFKLMTAEIQESILAGKGLITANNDLSKNLAETIARLQQKSEGLVDIPDKFDLIIDKTSKSLEQMTTTHTDTNDRLKSQIDTATADTKKLREELEAATKTLNDSLVSLTKQFAEKYKEFIETAQILMNK